MNPRQTAAGGQAGGPGKADPAPANDERFLTMLVEGVAKQIPEIDAAAYKQFRAKVSSLALQMPDRLPDADKLAVIRNVLREFEVCNAASTAAIRDRVGAWRGLTAKLLRELLAGLGIDESTEAAAPLMQQCGRLTTAEEIEEYRKQLDEFLHPSGSGTVLDHASPLKIADHTTANDNAAGLRGGGSAVEHLARIIERGGSGFIVVFRLSCLDIISDRFGMEAVQDCLMAVSAYLTHSLHGEDAVYHWSDSSLLAILERRSNEQILAVELRRIASNNRDIAIQAGGRSIMVRVPLEFDITPISSLQSANDLYKLSTDPAALK